MKRAAIIVVVCFVFYVTMTRIVPHFGEVSSGFGFKAPAIRQQPVQRPEPLVRPVDQLITSSPPLTNVEVAPQSVSTQVVPSFQLSKTNQAIVRTNAAPRRSGKPPRQDLIARVALSLVGADPDAEEYWVLAINDPSLGEAEREDLIEDLNEEGFVDPKRPTIEELPLVINRLQIIEDHAPFAMDEVNARSFAEAYKDLVNIYIRLTGEAPP